MNLCKVKGAIALSANRRLILGNWNTNIFSNRLLCPQHQRINQKRILSVSACDFDPVDTKYPCKHMLFRVEDYFSKTAVVDQYGTFSYYSIYSKSLSLAQKIVSTTSVIKSNETVIAFMCDNDVSFVVMLWAIWMTGCVALPLHHSYPPSQLEYFLKDMNAPLILSSIEHKEKLSKIPQTKLLTLLTDKSSLIDPSVKSIQRYEDMDFFIGDPWFFAKNALIIYTSGSTGRPKGVVLTHENIHINILGMIDAWKWNSTDHILHCLPLNHVHGVTNALLTPLYSGASVTMLPKFDPKAVFLQLLSEDSHKITIFMGVPTMYAMMVQYHEDNHIDKEEEVQEKLQQIRLFVSGSAALPIAVMEGWEEISGHIILERYGMTECGMALTNSYYGDRIPGAVGKPFKYVEVMIANQDTYVGSGYVPVVKGNSQEITVVKDDTQRREEAEGELLIKGPNVFKGYWNRPTANREAFTNDGWFKTGDIALYEDGVIKILGRISVDIIKYGGYKISALEVESVLLDHPDIAECVVVGVEDITWGQILAAVVVMKPGCEKLTPVTLKSWAEDKLPPHKIPKKVLCLDTIPRNLMGKVNKKEIIKKYFRGYA